MDIRHDQAATATRSRLEHYGFEGIFSSAPDRGWSGLSAQLCGTVRKGVIPWRTPQSDIRICVDTRGNESLVTRRAPGVESRIIARRGTVWLSPPGLQEGSVDIAEDMSGILHIYLPLSHFSPGNSDINIDPAAVRALSYESAFEDPLLAEIGCAIASELQAETSVGSLLIEGLASSLAARLIQKCIRASSGKSIVSFASGALDRRRLQRVLDYIEANLEGDLTLDLMASIACLSRYHFARAFKQAVGHPPHRYVSAKRLDRAKALLVQGERSLADIALALSFSDQASFTRAFRQATGRAPGQYRREFGSRQHDSSPADIRQALPMLA
ncbi:AraC family transcriptional regulator [Bradyrhizobium sp. B117]|uniref:AraC family transcriptional regulator n=1 Tax=Bradyrhizobium sp. B117 TaxID=3140246 RepID=UPI003183B004